MRVGPNYLPILIPKRVRFACRFPSLEKDLANTRAELEKRIADREALGSIAWAYIITDRIDSSPTDQLKSQGISHVKRVDDKRIRVTFDGEFKSMNYAAIISSTSGTARFTNNELGSIDILNDSAKPDEIWIAFFGPLEPPQSE